MNTGNQISPEIDLQVLLENESYGLQENKVLGLAAQILQFMGLGDYELSLLIVNDNKIHELNRDYRQKDKATDVLSFPQMDWKTALTVETKGQEKQQGPKILGDIVISLDHVAYNAEKIGNSISREFCFLLIHGILHLCGHDHREKEEEALMIGQQKIILDLLTGLSEKNEDPLWHNCIFKNKEEN